MKKVKILVAVISAGMLFASCESSDHENHEDQENHSEMESHEGHDHHDEAAKELSLNEGAKWAVNSEMMVHVRAMEKRITDFAASNTKNYSALASDLDKSIGELTSSCTMTGESHDQLHLWLLPQIKLVEELTAAKNDKEAATEFAKIQTSMVTFNQFFE
jgi:hypothetical protein